jgi:hypothetical protein
MGVTEHSTEFFVKILLLFRLGHLRENLQMGLPQKCININQLLNNANLDVTQDVLICQGYL